MWAGVRAREVAVFQPLHHPWVKYNNQSQELHLQQKTAAWSCSLHLGTWGEQIKADTFLSQDNLWCDALMQARNGCWNDKNWLIRRWEELGESGAQALPLESKRTNRFWNDWKMVTTLFCNCIITGRNKLTNEHVMHKSDTTPEDGAKSFFSCLLACLLEQTCGLLIWNAYSFNLHVYVQPVLLPWWQQRSTPIVSY